MFHRIQNRLIILFVTVTAAILLMSGGLLRWSLRQNLEEELGRKLMAVAGSASVLFDDEELIMLQNAGSRTRKRLGERLERLMSATDIRRIYLFDKEGSSLLDTHPLSSDSRGNFNLQFFNNQLNTVNRGEKARSILYETMNGEPAMTGFAPIFLDSQIVGGVGVEGSVSFLSSVRRMEEQLIIIGGLGLLAAIVLGLILSRSITNPIQRLVRETERIGRGDYDQPIPVSGKDEIGRLARTMDEMRQSVIEREKTLKAMLAGVAHEIRNPLGGIELFTGLLSDEVRENRSASDQVARISKETAHLKEIVDSFLSYARPQSSHPQDCPLKEILLNASELLKGKFQKKSIEIDIEVPNQLLVWFDPHHLKRILLNLLYNSIQATEHAGTIECAVSGSGSLIIRDSGKGISEEDQDQIFEPFFTTRQQGTGLGLSIVKQLVEANGGHIELAGSDKNGTVFEITFHKNDS